MVKGKKLFKTILEIFSKSIANNDKTEYIKHMCCLTIFPGNLNFSDF